MIGRSRGQDKLLKTNVESLDIVIETTVALPHIAMAKLPRSAGVFE
jgi:hypothetical protein